MTGILNMFMEEPIMIILLLGMQLGIFFFGFVMGSIFKENKLVEKKE